MHVAGLTRSFETVLTEMEMCAPSFLTTALGSALSVLQRVVNCCAEPWSFLMLLQNARANGRLCQGDGGESSASRADAARG